MEKGYYCTSTRSLINRYTKSGYQKSQFIAQINIQDFYWKVNLVNLCGCYTG